MRKTWVAMVPAGSTSPVSMDGAVRFFRCEAQTCSMLVTSRDGQRYLLNLIDTPGHVDFSYEVLGFAPEDFCEFFRWFFFPIFGGLVVGGW